MSGTDRRALLTGGAAAGAALAAAVSAKAAKTATTSGERPLIINALGGLEDPAAPPTESGDGVDLAHPAVNYRAIRDARDSGMNAVNVTLGYVSGPMEPFEYTVRTIGVWDEIVRSRPADLIKVRTTADILRAKGENKIGVIYGFQNAAMMGKRADRVDIFADLGVRIIQLTYNVRNQLGDGSMVREGRGLTPFGREVVERLNARRIMVDLSHSGRAICLDAARASKAPISINHTGCQALSDRPRNKTDEELRLVAEKGGFVGIYFMPFLRYDSHPTTADVVAHIEHAVKVCGEDHVGIGTDGVVSTPGDMKAELADAARQYAARHKAGVAAPGEGPDVLAYIPELQRPSQFRDLAAALAARGHSSSRIDKILGRNFLRYAQDVWGA